MIELIDWSEIKQSVPVTRKTLGRWIAQGKFPKEVLPRLWRKDQVEAAVSGKSWDMLRDNGQMQTDADKPSLP